MKKTACSCLDLSVSKSHLGIYVIAFNLRAVSAQGKQRAWDGFGLLNQKCKVSGDKLLHYQKGMSIDYFHHYLYRRKFYSKIWPCSGPLNLGNLRDSLPGIWKNWRTRILKSQMSLDTSMVMAMLCPEDLVVRLIANISRRKQSKMWLVKEMSGSERDVWFISSYNLQMILAHLLKEWM